MRINPEKIFYKQAFIMLAKAEQAFPINTKGLFVSAISDGLGAVQAIHQI